MIVFFIGLVVAALVPAIMIRTGPTEDKIAGSILGATFYMLIMLLAQLF